MMQSADCMQSPHVCPSKLGSRLTVAYKKGLKPHGFGPFRIGGNYEYK